MTWIRLTIGMLVALQVFVFAGLVYQTLRTAAVYSEPIFVLLAVILVIAGLQLLDAHIAS